MEEAKFYYDHHPFIFIFLFIAFVVIAQLWFNIIYEAIKRFYPDQKPPVLDLIIIALFGTFLLTSFIVYFTDLPITSITVG